MAGLWSKKPTNKGQSGLNSKPSPKPPSSSPKPPTFGGGTVIEGGIGFGDLGKEEVVEEDPYMKMYEAYASQLAGMSAAQKASINARYNEAKNMMNQNYDRNANYAYVNYRQGQKDLSEQLSNLGATGGASESANLKLQNNYGQNLAQNEYNRNNDLSQVNTSYNDALAGVESDLNAQLAEAYAQYANQSQQWQQEQAAKKEALAKQKEVDRWNNNVMANISKRQSQGYETNVWYDQDGKVHYRLTGNNKNKQSELDKWNNAVQKNIAKRQREGYNIYKWTDNAGKLHYQTVGKKKVSSSGGSSKSSSSSKGRSSAGAYTASSGNSGASGANYKRVQTNIANALLKDSSLKARNNYENIIKEELNKGGITESQAKKLLNMIG